jgi:hypothetical protein
MLPRRATSNGLIRCASACRRQHSEGILSSPLKIHRHHRGAHHHHGCSHPTFAAYSQCEGVGHCMSPGARSGAGEPAELPDGVSPSKIPGSPAGVAYYRQHYPRRPPGSVRIHPAVWWREASLVPGSHEGSYTPGPHLEIKGGHHPTLKRTCAVWYPGQQNPEKQTYQ